MRQTEAFRTDTFRTAAMACAAFGATTLLLFGFIYWQTAGFENFRVNAFIRNEMRVLAREDSAQMARDVSARYSEDLHRQAFAAIFAADGTKIVGGIAALPIGLPLDNMVHDTIALRIGDSGPMLESVHAVARRLEDGTILVVGRDVADLAKLRSLVLRALWLGLAPAMIAALCIGLLASRRTLARVSAMNAAIASIMQGHLHERLPSAGSRDALEQLAASCNRMLAEIERLLEDVKGVGENIAHDLRAPLARLRARMESGLARKQDHAALETVLAGAIEELDRGLAVITALLRIGELESGRRRAAFAAVDLSALVQEAGELYAPLADDRGLRFEQSTLKVDDIVGDHALLLEVVVNLLDNAMKFAPARGAVSIAVLEEQQGPAIRVADTGPGIAPDEVSRVMERFHRAAPNRHLAGNGIGLNLVSAILRLHGFGIRMARTDQGFAVDILCWPDGPALRAVTTARPGGSAPWTPARVRDPGPP